MSSLSVTYSILDLKLLTDLTCLSMLISLTLFSSCRPLRLLSMSYAIRHLGELLGRTKCVIQTSAYLDLFHPLVSFIESLTYFDVLYTLSLGETWGVPPLACSNYPCPLLLPLDEFLNGIQSSSVYNKTWFFLLPFPSCKHGVALA